MAAKAAPTQVPAGFTQWEDMIRGVIADMDAVLVDVKAAIDGLDEVDLASQDVAIKIRGGAREGPLVPLRAPRRSRPTPAEAPVLGTGASPCQPRCR